MSEAWDSATTYQAGDEVIHTPRKVVFLTGWAWLLAKLTGRPTQRIEEGKPQVYRAVVTPDVGSFEGWKERPSHDLWVGSDIPLDREDFEVMNGGGVTAEMLIEIIEASNDSRRDIDQAFFHVENPRDVIMDGHFNLEDIARRLNEADR